MNLGLRYEYYRAADEERSEVRLELLLRRSERVGEHEHTAADHRRHPHGQRAAVESEPDRPLWKSDWNNFAPRLGLAWDVTGDGRTSLRGGYGMAYERNFGNVTYNVLFNPPDYLVATIDAPTNVASQPIYTDNAGPFGGVAGVTEDDPGRQPSSRRSEHRDGIQRTSTACRSSVS